MIEQSLLLFFLGENLYLKNIQPPHLCILSSSFISSCSVHRYIHLFIKFSWIFLLLSKSRIPPSHGGGRYKQDILNLISLEKYEENAVGTNKRQNQTWLGEELRAVFLEEMLRVVQVKKQGKK